MDDNAFGKLVRSHREQREWKQNELADRWGFTREYVSQIERGKRKLDNPEQVARLAEILGISEEQLAQVGKGKSPQRRSSQHGDEGDDILLEALLKPVETTVKLSCLIWQGNGLLPNLTLNLHDLERRLNNALGLYRGQFRQPALRIIAYVHELLGKQSVEQTDTQDAIRSFQAMYDIAEELGDSDLLIQAMIHQATMSRRKGHFEASFRRLNAAEKYSHNASHWLKGHLWKISARNSYLYGDEQSFLRSIDRAANIAENIQATVDTITNGFDKIAVLQERAQGYTILWQPDKALKIYQETDKMRPLRSLREQSLSHIVKAQAYCYSGDLQTGIEHALAGLRLAEQLQSSHYVLRLQQMSDRLGVTSIGKEKVMRDLRGEILSTRYKLCQGVSGW